MTAEEELAQLKQLLRTVLDEKRHCYDYTAKWHYLAANREEWKSLLKAAGLDIQAAKFDPTKKRASK